MLNNNLKLSAAALLAALALSPAPARAGQNLDYYLIGNQAVSITEAGAVKETVLPEPRRMPGDEKQVMAAAAIINGGLKAWKVFSKGAPSAGSSSSYASAIPAGLYNDWSSVTKWKGPKEYIYDYTVTNRLGVDVINVKYKISYYYDGKTPGEKNGGAYIANFTVQPVAIAVKWGWHFDLDVVMSDPMNVGSVPDPVAMLQADLHWRVSTMLSSSGDFGIWTYAIDGKGNFKDLTDNNKALTRAILTPTACEPPVIAWD